jgi:hypothetical protein
MAILSARARACVVGLGASAVVLLTATPSRAQNADPFFYGDEAALAGGAVVATGRDSSAFWYNPAGFGGLRRGLVSASGTTFGLRFRTVPNALRVRVGGRETGSSISSTDVVSVPNAIVIATKLTPRIALAGGLLVTARDVRSALVREPEREQISADGTPVALAQRLDVQADLSKYHFGAALGAALTERLRLGVSVFGTYAKETDSVQYSLAARSAGPNPTGEAAFSIYNERTTASAFGVAATAGVQWQPSDDLSIGLAVRSPEVAITGSTDGGAVIATANAGGTDPAQATVVGVPPPELAAGGTLIAPARALFGVAVALGPRESWVELGVDASHGLPETSVINAQAPTFNGRVGARYMLSPGWIIGGGVFSDRATLRNIPDFVGADRVDYYGVTAGVSKRTPLGLTTDPSPEALLLVTTFSLRAAVGLGEARAETLDFDQPDLPRDDRSDVTFVDLMPYIGSSVAF